MNADGLKRMRDEELQANLSGCWREIRKIEAETVPTASVMDDAKYVALLNMAVTYRHELDRRASA